MTKKLSFIEEAETKGFKYRPGGILGNGFYGNELYITLTEMEKLNKIGQTLPERVGRKDFKRINAEFFIECEDKEDYYTSDLLELFPDIKTHQLHNFLNRYREVFSSQKLFTIVGNRRIFSKEAVKFIYDKLVKSEEPAGKKRGRRSLKSEVD